MIFFTTATHDAHFDEEEHGVDDSVLEEGFGDDVSDDDLESDGTPVAADTEAEGAADSDEEDADDLLAELEEDADEVVNDSYDDQDDI